MYVALYKYPPANLVQFLFELIFFSHRLRQNNYSCRRDVIFRQVCLLSPLDVSRSKNPREILTKVVQALKK